MATDRGRLSGMTAPSPQPDRGAAALLPPHRPEGAGALAAAAARGLRPLTFEVAGADACTFVAGDDDVAVVTGPVDGATVVRLSRAAWDHFVTERWTRYALLYTGSIDLDADSFAQLCLWEPALRALLHGRPVYDAAALRLLDRVGSPLDLERSFSLDDDPADAAHFLQTTGYLHLRAVFGADEVAALRREVEDRAAAASPDDASSGHWTRDADGAPVVANLKYGAVGSAALTALHDDPRVRAAVALAGEPDLRPNLDRNEGTKVIFKRPGASEGLVDLPLHSDCGMGFHPIACPMILIGVHLDDGTPASGQLHVVAGSHRSTTPDPVVVDTSGWPVVALGTRAGDCTVHYGHVLHAAPPPSGELPEGAHARRTAYLCFAPPSLFATLAPFEDLTTLMHGAGGVNALPEDLLAAR
jgi:hypothetical protein